MIEDIFKKNNIEYYKKASLKKYNTYKVEATCKYLVFPNNLNDVIEILKYLKNTNIKYFFLGNGSNVILDFSYYDGVVIKLSKLNNIEINKNIIKVGAGFSVITLAITAANNNLTGLEFAGGIPGAVGASVAMNAGAYKKDMASIVKEVKVITPANEIITMKNKDLNFLYRDSFFKHNRDYICVEATLELDSGDKDKILNLMEDRRQRRISSQPLEFPSAGSVFRNPEGMFAGDLIENEIHYKGKNINGAEVSAKHANFIINKGTATGNDIVTLINEIKKEVKNKCQVDLILEQEIIR